MPINIEITQTPDVQALAAMHAACFAKGWDADSIRAMFGVAGTFALVAVEQKGFALLRSVGDDAEILTLAVPSEFRRQGIAAAIVDKMRQQASGQGAKTLFLEVGKSNLAAESLYRKAGFSVLSHRRDYYRKPDGSSEDAVIMRLAL